MVFFSSLIPTPQVKYKSASTDSIVKLSRSTSSLRVSSCLYRTFNSSFFSLLINVLMAMYLTKYVAYLKCPFYYYVGNRLVTELEIDISSYILRPRVLFKCISRSTFGSINTPEARWLMTWIIIH